MMKAIDLLATSMHRRDDVPNQKLADEIIAGNRHEWVKELVEHLNHKDKNIQSDCIKVLYEIGERNAPDLIAPYWEAFIKILVGKNNRLIWGAMTALDMIALIKPGELCNHLDTISRAIENGSVITIDHGVSILAKLASVKKYEHIALPLLIDRLAKCPAKQFPMYIEKSVIAMNSENRSEFSSIIAARYSDLEKDSQKKRVDRILKRLKTF
jgi:hypothetical protein